jgi:hypothetical protein
VRVRQPLLRTEALPQHPTISPTCARLSRSPSPTIAFSAVLYLVSNCFATGPGVDLSALGLLAQNDDAGAGLVCSTIRYRLSPLAAARTFYVMVEGHGYNEGRFILCVRLVAGRSVAHWGIGAVGRCVVSHSFFT